MKYQNQFVVLVGLILSFSIPTFASQFKVRKVKGNQAIIETTAPLNEGEVYDILPQKIAIDPFDSKKYQSRSRLINLGLEEAIKLELINMNIHFQLAQGIHNFQVKKYEAASNQLRNAAAGFELQKDTLNKILAELYLAKCMWIQKDKGNALPYLFNIDKSVSQLKYNKPEHRVLG